MADEKRNKRTIQVKIYGKEYSIRSTEDPEIVEEVARYVDSKMTETHKGANSSSPVEAAVLAAMNITGELFHERALNEKLKSELDDRSRALVERISSMLETE